MYYLEQIDVLLPEIIIFLSGIFLLIYGAFSKIKGFINVNLLTIIGLTIAAISLFFVRGDASAFNNSFINNPDNNNVRGFRISALMRKHC